MVDLYVEGTFQDQKPKHPLPTLPLSQPTVDGQLSTSLPSRPLLGSEVHTIIKYVQTLVTHWAKGNFGTLVENLCPPPPHKKKKKTSQAGGQSSRDFAQKDI